MIFVTVGMHDGGFDRLVRAADGYAATRPEKVVIQKGSSSYGPVHAEAFDFAEAERIAELAQAARVVVTHAGAGSLLNAFANSAALVVVPRLKRYGEHVDNHQLELAEALHRIGRVRMIRSVSELPGVLDQDVSPGPANSNSVAPLVGPLRALIADITARRL